MNLEGAKMQNGPWWAWARTGALILFLLTGILLLASLGTARSQNTSIFPTGAPHAVEAT